MRRFAALIGVGIALMFLASVAAPSRARKKSPPRRAIPPGGGFFSVCVFFLMDPNGACGPGSSILRCGW